MDFQVHQTYTSEALSEDGLEVPGGAEVDFWADPGGSEDALYLVLDSGQCWCNPPTSDRRLCFLYSPSRIRLGVDRCRNKSELLRLHGPAKETPGDFGRVHLFGALGDRQWCYLGRPVLGSGFGTRGDFHQFDIGLDEKLPRWLWLRFGGYSGWLVCAGPRQWVLDGHHGADKILLDSWGSLSSTIEITRYQEDVLFAVTDGTGASVVLHQADSDKMHSQSDSPCPPDVEEYGFGDFEFPPDWVIPRQLAINVIRQYLATGAPVGLVRE